MRVALKLALAMVVLLMAVRFTEGVLTVQRETGRLDASIERNARLLGHIMEHAAQEAWESGGRDQALEQLASFNLDDHPVQISWASFEGEDGLRQWLDAESLETLLGGAPATLRRHSQTHGEAQYHFVPLGIPDADGVIQQVAPLEHSSRYLRHALAREAIAGGLVFLIGGGAMLVLGVVSVGRPLSRLRERVRQIGEGDLATCIVLRGSDELATLAAGLNDMCARLTEARAREAAEVEKRLQAMDQMRHMDRLTTIGRLASGVAHELGTPLNVIAGRAGMVAASAGPLDEDRVRKSAETIKAQADRMTAIIRHLLDFARRRPPQRVESHGGAIVHQAIELVNCLGYKGQVRVAGPLDGETLSAPMDPVQMQQVLTNLIENALQAMPDGGEAVVSLRSAPADPPVGIAPVGRYLQIAVEDSGLGIAPEDQDKVFDPFFTTKDVGQGTGLGLSISHGIVRDHGGWIDVASEVGAGSRFTVNIPQEEAPWADAS